MITSFFFIKPYYSAIGQGKIISFYIRFKNIQPRDRQKIQRMIKYTPFIYGFFMQADFFQHVEALEDARVDKTKPYPLIEIVSWIISATISGCDG